MDQTTCAHCGSLNGGHTLACQSIHAETDKPAQVPMTTPQDPTPAASGLPELPDIDQRARDLFAAEYERDGIEFLPGEIRKPNSMLTMFEDRAIRAIKAALAAQPAPVVGGDALSLAVRFHETYERLAPSFGYETRTDTRTFDPESKNGRLMVAVCKELLSARPAESVTPVVNASLIKRARAEYRDSDAAGDVLDWMEEQLDTESVAQGGEAVLGLPEDGAYLIRYDDHDEADELFAYSGARENAFRRYRDRSSSWNAHLYVKIDSNSRDCEVPSAKAHPAPAGGDAGEA